MTSTIPRDDELSRARHRLLDIGLNWLALACAYLLKHYGRIGTPTDPFGWPEVLQTLIAIALIWSAVTSVLETYAYKRPLFQETINLITALALTIAFSMTLVYFTRSFVYPRYLTVLYAVWGSAFLAASRLLKHLIRQSLHRHGYLLRRLLIVGDTDVARRLAHTCRQHDNLGYRVVGLVYNGLPADDAPPPLGRIDELETLIPQHRVDEVIVALPGREHDQVLEIAHRCQKHSVRIRVVPDLFDVVMARATVTEIDDIPLIGLRDPVISGYRSWVKRVFDILVATFCIMLFSPLFIIIPILIWFDSRGRILYVQERAGENGRPFPMYKFRSMVADADERLSDLVDLDALREPVYKIPNDPRITRVGRFLRRTSLDELPQFFNVLLGQMSVVGPRPESMEMVDRYNLWQRKRLSVKPGITGPMQVGGRGELSLEERIRIELLYISDYSVLNDLKYILRTIPAVLRGKGAY
jgi:exopolysaccharide biosynthesis polyprenyl glycosylphosphotransferase